MTDLVHRQTSRTLTRTEMQFFSYTQDERQAIALAQVCTLPENPTYAEIEDAVLKCFTIALEHAGLKDSIEYVGGQRRDMVNSARGLSDFGSTLSAMLAEAGAARVAPSKTVTSLAVPKSNGRVMKLLQKLLQVSLLVIAVVVGSLAQTQQAAQLAPGATVASAGPSSVNIGNLGIVAAFPLVSRNGRGIPFDAVIHYTNPGYAPIEAGNGQVTWQKIGGGWQQPFAGMSYVTLYGGFDFQQLSGPKLGWLCNGTYVTEYIIDAFLDKDGMWHQLPTGIAVLGQILARGPHQVKALLLMVAV